MNVDRMFSGPFQALEELTLTLAKAFDEGYTESEGSFVVPFRGYDFEVTVRMDPETKPSGF